MAIIATHCNLRPLDVTPVIFRFHYDYDDAPRVNFQHSQTVRLS